MLNLLHVGLGPLGKIMISDMARRGIAKVTAAVDIDPALTGKKLSGLVPECGFDAEIYPSIARATTLAALGQGSAGRAKPFDAVLLTTSSDLAKCAPSLRELIPLGLPIVSTCEELLYPWLRHKALADELDALAKRHGARLLGTGVNPGFLMDTLPVAATAVCRAVRSVKIWRIQDATTRRIPFQKKIGAGLDDAAFQSRITDGSLRHVGLGESIHFVAHYLGFHIDRWEESIEPVKADRDIAATIGPIKKGSASGVRQVARAWGTTNPKPDTRTPKPDSPPILEFTFQAAIGQSDPHDRVVIDGEPPLDLTLKGGVHGDIATSAISLNAIPSLIAAPPGLHTMATIPLVRFVR
jgi:4-hydroxy-tetrahydrodipicolinate reductase